MRLSPALGLVALFCRVEVVVGVAAGLGELAISKLKMGSPSSSKRCAVSMSQAGYRRVGLFLMQSWNRWAVELFQELKEDFGNGDRECF